jgi:hypothetical protein
VPLRADVLRELTHALAANPNSGEYDESIVGSQVVRMLGEAEERLSGARNDCAARARVAPCACRAGACAPRALCLLCSCCPAHAYAAMHP